MRRPALSALRRAADPVLVGCFVLLLGFPIVAWVAGHGQPRAPAAARPVATPPGPPARVALREVPAFASKTDLTQPLASAAAMEAAVHDALVETFGPRRGAALWRIARTYRTGIDAVELIDVEHIPYPFRYPPIDRVLDGAQVPPRAANDVAAMLILAAAREGGSDAIPSDFPNAARVAFAILDRARAGGDCLPQLNLAFLVSTDRNPRDDDVAREYGAAARACPGDPTPLWLLGQFQSQRAFAYDNNDRPGQSSTVPTACAGRSPRSGACGRGGRGHRSAGPARPMPSCASRTRSRSASRSVHVSGSVAPLRSTAPLAASTTMRASATARRGRSPGSGGMPTPPRCRPPRSPRPPTTLRCRHAASSTSSGPGASARRPASPRSSRTGPRSRLRARCSPGSRTTTTRPRSGSRTPKGRSRPEATACGRSGSTSARAEPAAPGPTSPLSRSIATSRA